MSNFYELKHALKINNFELAELLRKKNPDLIDRKDRSGKGLLEYMVIDNKPEAFFWLLDHGAKTQDGLNQWKKQWTVFYEVINEEKEGQSKCVYQKMQHKLEALFWEDMALNASARDLIHLMQKDDPRLIQSFLEKFPNIKPSTMEDKKEFWLKYFGMAHPVKALKNWIEWKEDEVPLSEILETAFTSNHFNTLQELKERKINWNQVYFLNGCNILTALSFFKKTMDKWWDWLEDLNIDVNIKDDNGFTPLYKAATAGQITMVQWLLKKGADPCVVQGKKNQGKTVIRFLEKGDNRLERSVILAEITQSLLDTLAQKNRLALQKSEGVSPIKRL